MAKKKDFVPNRFGVKIVRCCASCVFNAGAKNGESTRICKAGEGVVRPSSVCGNWEMKECLDNAGLNNGRVKKKRYLFYSLKRHVEEREKADKAKDKKELYTTATVDDIRAEYMEKFGSIYLSK